MRFLWKICLKNIKNRKTRTVMVYSTVLISAMLLSITMISLGGITHLNHEVVAANNVNYHVRMRNIDSQVIKSLEKDPSIDSLMTSINIAKIVDAEVNAYLVCNMVEKKGIYLPDYKTGTYPAKVNEAACSGKLLELLNVQAEPGRKFNISYRINNQGLVENSEFVLSGILEDSELSADNIRKSLTTYSMFVSEEFFENLAKNNTFNVTTFICMKVPDNATYDGVNASITELLDKYSISNENITINTGYLKATTKAGVETVLLGICIAIMTVSFGGIVLYCVYSAFMILDIQNIGRYRVLGADRRQIKQMLYFENLVIVLCGIISGMILGYIISWKGLHILYSKFNIVSLPQLITPQLILIIALIIILEAVLSLRPVIRKNLMTSPIKSLHFNYYESFDVRRRSCKYISVNELVKLDLEGNKKNVIASVLTMGISCMVFLGVSGLSGSVSIENFVKSTLREGDFIVKYVYEQNDKEYTENNLYSKQLAGTIQNIKGELCELEGVKKVTGLNLALADLSYPNTDFDKKRVTIGTYSKEDVKYLSENVNKGNIEYTENSEKPGIIYTWGNSFEESGFSIGDRIQISFLVGDTVVEKEFELIASTMTLEEGTFLIQDNIMQQIFEGYDAAYGLAVYVEQPYYLNVKNVLNEISMSNGMELISRDEETAYAKEILAIIKYPTMLICVFMGMIGFVTIINTMIVSMIKRKKEIALFQCLGMTKGQLFAMILKEILFLITGVVIIGFLLGNIIGFVLVQYAISNVWIGVKTFSLPWHVMIGLLMVLLAGSFIIAALLCEFLSAKSAVGQLRASDY